MPVAPYVTPAQLRTVSGLETEPSDAVLAAYVAEFEEIAEAYRGQTYTPRTAVETHFFPSAVRNLWLGRTDTQAFASRQPIRSITSVTIDGVTDAATNYDVNRSAALSRASGWSGSVVVTYAYGLDAPPASLIRACKLYVGSAVKADRGSVKRDTISLTVDGQTMRYSTPDFDAGRPTGWLEVDRILNALADHREIGVA